MLVLKRKRGQTIVISLGSRRITLRITEVYDGNVRLAFEGPREVEIWRGEIQQEIDAEARRASSRMSGCH